MRGPAWVLAAGATMLLSFPAYGQADGPRCGLDAEAVFARAAQGVVEVASIAINPYRAEDRVNVTVGSGMVLPDGLVLTNEHVVSGANAIVVFSETESWEAGIVGSDRPLDIAVLRLVDADSPLQSLEFAPPESLQPGQDVYAIGFPLGLGKSISRGIVSGTGRVLSDSTFGWQEPMIQTDAPVNPGNSGGPLLDDCGRVLGMVARSGSESSAESVGFAIPATLIQSVLPELTRTGRIARPWHGLYGQMVSPPMTLILDFAFLDWEQSQGFLVETVEPGSAADRLGLRGGDLEISVGGFDFLLGGDIITAVNGVHIDSLDTALAVVRDLRIGQEITVDYVRQGESLQGKVTLEERPPHLEDGGD